MAEAAACLAQVPQVVAKGGATWIQSMRGNIVAERPKKEEAQKTIEVEGDISVGVIQEQQQEASADAATQSAAMDVMLAKMVEEEPGQRQQQERKLLQHEQFGYYSDMEESTDAEAQQAALVAPPPPSGVFSNSYQPRRPAPRHDPMDVDRDAAQQRRLLLESRQHRHRYRALIVQVVDSMYFNRRALEAAMQPHIASGAPPQMVIRTDMERSTFKRVLGRAAGGHLRIYI